MRRVLRKIGGEHSEEHSYSKAIALTLTIVFIFASVAVFINPPGHVVDAEIGYVINPLNEEKCLRRWVFGDEVICKILKKHVVSMGATTKVWKMEPATIPVIDYGSIQRSPESMFKLHGKSSFTGEGVVVAVIDTGIDYTHPAFEYSITEIWTTLYTSQTGTFLHWIMGQNGTVYELMELDHSLKAAFGEYAFADESGHGTHVAGIIAGRPVGDFVGFAPNAKLFIVKAFYKNGTAPADMILDALKIVYDNVERIGIKVVNISWGALLYSDGSDPISTAAAKIAEKDVLVFAAAGNEGNLPFKILSPAVHADIIALGAIDPETGKIASFSSWGTTIDLRMKPDFVTAGVGIISARSSFSNLQSWSEDPRLTYASGTSMSSAVASGIGALYSEYWMKMVEGVGLRESFLRFQNQAAERINPYYKDFVSGLGILATL